MAGFNLAELASQVRAPPWVSSSSAAENRGVTAVTHKVTLLLQNSTRMLLLSLHRLQRNRRNILFSQPLQPSPIYTLLSSDILQRLKIVDSISEFHFHKVWGSYDRQTKKKRGIVQIGAAEPEMRRPRDGRLNLDVSRMKPFNVHIATCLRVSRVIVWNNAPPVPQNTWGCSMAPEVMLLCPLGGGSCLSTQQHNYRQSWGSLHTHTSQVWNHKIIVAASWK